MIVHGRANSSNVQAVMWGAAEMGLTPERRDVGGQFGGTDTPAFRAMNPMGRVPVLEDGDTVLFESGVILRYLEAHYGTGNLGAAGPRAESWAEWAKHSLGDAFTGPIFWTFWRTPEADRDMDLVLRNLRTFETRLALAMDQRGTGPWIMGAALTRADIWAGHVLYRYFTLDLPREAPTGAEAYYRQMTERPAYQTHIMRPYDELKGRLDY